VRLHQLDPNREIDSEISFLEVLGVNVVKFRHFYVGDLEACDLQLLNDLA
jgi:hypothetical protein